MKKEDCIYLEVCDRECSDSCLRYLETKYMLENSNIPKAKWRMNILYPDQCDLEAFSKLSEIRSTIIDFTENGSSLYIYSTNCGNGKTTWAIKLMLQYFHEKWPGNGFTKRGVFVNVPTFLYKCKEQISHPDPEFELMKKSLETIDLVIWDEIAGTRLSEYDFNNILVLLNTRELNEKANIFTSNIRPSELEKYVGNKLASRINGNCIKVELKGGDKR